ncbi:unnamed protein product [Rhizoctonia solani]|uniref:DUF6593 domain-containing protein n=1 Tax=Rhizoctonia solani TaxID=456999 RepID=A0A8H3AM25_9AGAM|nr:unnamed protein product [Rhizoctonia solani]
MVQQSNTRVAYNLDPWFSGTNSPPSVMTTYTLSETSPERCNLMDPEGNIIYKISSPVTMGNSDVTIMRGEEVIAVIHWKWFEQSTLTMNNRTTELDEVFPRPKKMSPSRVYTMPDGSQFKWKGADMIYAVNVETRLNVATYYRSRMHLINSKKSMLDIAAGASTELTDALVVTWAIYEKRAKDLRWSMWGK